MYLQVSSTENMSLSVIDALRHGVPAVVTDVGGLPEIVEHGKSGLVVPSAPSEVIAESVTEYSLVKMNDRVSLGLVKTAMQNSFLRGSGNKRCAHCT